MADPGLAATLAQSVSAAAPDIGVLAFGFLAGAMVPTYYAQERLRGFGRAMADKLPYKPPPGMEADEAMRAALESAEEQEADGDDDPN